MVNFDLLGRERPAIIVMLLTRPNPLDRYEEELLAMGDEYLQKQFNWLDSIVAGIGPNTLFYFRRIFSSVLGHF